MKQLQMRRAIGPLSIFLCPLLFVAFLSRPKHAFDFAELTQRVARNILFHAAQVVGVIHSQLFRSVAVARLNRLLEFFWGDSSWHFCVESSLACCYMRCLAGFEPPLAFNWIGLSVALQTCY